MLPIIDVVDARTFVDDAVKTLHCPKLIETNPISLIVVSTSLQVNPHVRSYIPSSIIPQSK
jgi:hypothetical protein